MISRHQIAAINRDEALWLPVGPLPPGEAILFLRQRLHLIALMQGCDEDLALAQWVLEVSRGHPHRRALVHPGR